METPQFIRWSGNTSNLAILLKDPSSGTAFNPTDNDLLFTVKARVFDPDTAAKIQKLSTVGGITVLNAVNGSISIELVPDDSTRIEVGLTYIWGVKAQHQTTGAVKTVANGTLSLIQDVTRGLELSVPTFLVNPPLPATAAAQAAEASAVLATEKADQTTSDAQATAADRVATGDDRTQTGLDRTAVAANKAATDTAKSGADTAAATATTQAGIATTQASLADTAKTAAEAARDLAQTYKDAASASSDNATTAKTAAQAAQSAAETAQAAAVTAKTAAQTAQTAAETAQSAAASSANAAASSATTATSAKNAALAAQAAAEAAQASAIAQASAAAASAAAALASQNATNASAIAAAASATTASTQATTATTQAAAAAASATTALNAIAQQFKGGVAGSSVPATSTAAGDTYRIISAGTSQSKTWSIGDAAIYNGTSGSWTQLTGYYGALDEKSDAYPALAKFTSALAKAGAYARGLSGATAHRVNVIQIGDSTGSDLFQNATCAQAIEAYGFGGIQKTLSLYDGADVTTSGVTFPNGAYPATIDRSHSILGHVSMDSSGAYISIAPNVWYFSQAPNATNSGQTTTPWGITGFRVVWVKGSGSFKIQHSAYAALGDAAYNTPTWVDGATVDTSTGSAPIQATDIAVTTGLYRFRILQTAGTPLLSYWGFLGASGFNRGGPFGNGGDYLSKYLECPEANWAALLAIAAPDLITLQFKNNGGDTLAAWTTQLNTLVGYLHSYAPAASVVLVGNYNSESDDTYTGPQMSMPQQRALLKSVATANNWVYIDASELFGGSYATANANGLMNDPVHSNDAGKAVLTGYFTSLAKMYAAQSCIQPYQKPATGVTAGTYKSVTVDAAGRVMSGSNPAATPNFYTGTRTMTLSADTTYVPTESDDGKLISVVTGIYKLMVSAINSGTVRDGFNVSFVKTDTGTGYICQLYAQPWIVNCNQQGEGVQLIQDSGLSKIFWRRFQMVVDGNGNGRTGVTMKITAGTPTGFGDAGQLGFDSTNKLLYYVNNGGGAGATWKLLSPVGTVSVASGKTITVSNTLTITATDGSTLAIGMGGTLGTAAYTASTAYATAAQGTKADTAGAVHATTPLSAYAAGTAYTLTNTPALVDFGTTDPTITFATAGTYLVQARVLLKYNYATFPSNETATLKLIRTNNTPADIANATTTATLRIITNYTDTVGVMQLPPVIYTANAGDVVSLYGSVSTVPATGSVDCTEASVVAIRLY